MKVYKWMTLEDYADGYCRNESMMIEWADEWEDDEKLKMYSFCSLNKDIWGWRLRRTFSVTEWVLVEFEVPRVFSVKRDGMKVDEIIPYRKGDWEDLVFRVDEVRSKRLVRLVDKIRVFIFRRSENLYYTISYFVRKIKESDLVFNWPVYLFGLIAYSYIWVIIINYIK